MMGIAGDDGKWVIPSARKRMMMVIIITKMIIISPLPWFLERSIDDGPNSFNPP